jgi:hypothetical protein
MFRRNVDFIAVFVIAVAMLGFSRAASLRLPEPDSIRFQNAVSSDSCAFSEAFSRIAYILDESSR